VRRNPFSPSGLAKRFIMKELLVPLLIVAILGSMILPLPPFVIDFMLVANLVLAMVLLGIALYISDPLKLSSLPSILLLATLYRLALNVSTTRLILGSGQGGEVIEAFGTTVIQGNVIVGLIIFAIITLIQFIVIAKGSERVAEVSARFTLDALPGKQMSIDADVRSGLIDFETARKKRHELQVESRFYGALDGAMKFVKGDAIAGIVIIIVNLIGGFAIGTLIEGRDLTAALSKYTTLSIGDGLLSQLPALLNSLAAGIIVTRVVNHEGNSLVKDLVSQLGQLKNVKVATALFSVGLSLAPGMPTTPFLILALLLLGGALFSKSELPSKIRAETFIPRVPATLSLELGADLARAIYNTGEANNEIEQFRKSIHEQYGLILLPPELALADPLELSKGAFKIKLRGTTVHSAELKEQEYTPKEVLKALSGVVKEKPQELIDDILTRRTLDFFDNESPELVSAVVPTVMNVTKLTEILKGLTSEGVTIRNFDIILQAIAEQGAANVSTSAYLEEVRIALKRVICEQHQQEDGVIRGFAIEPALDLAIAKSAHLAEGPDIELLSLIKERVQNGLPKSTNEGKVVLLTSRESRLTVREYLLLNEIKIPVIAYEELTAETKFECIECIEQSEDLENELMSKLVA